MMISVRPVKLRRCHGNYNKIHITEQWRRWGDFNVVRYENKFYFHKVVMCSCRQTTRIKGHNKESWLLRMTVLCLYTQNNV